MAETPARSYVISRSQSGTHTRWAQAKAPEPPVREKAKQELPPCFPKKTVGLAETSLQVNATPVASLGPPRNASALTLSLH